MSDLFIARFVAVCALAFCGICALSLIAALRRFDPSDYSEAPAVKTSTDARHSDAVPAGSRVTV